MYRNKSLCFLITSESSKHKNSGGKLQHGMKFFSHGFKSEEDILAHAFLCSLVVSSFIIVTLLFVPPFSFPLCEFQAGAVKINDSVCNQD